MHSFSSFQTHSWSSEMGDHIGMESCVDLIKQNHDEVVVIDGGGCMEEKEYSRRRCGGDEKRDRRWDTRREKKEYPPPVPSQMPWVLKRYYTSDGRLIIREEKVKRHEYFRAERSNGRLSLRLIPLDDDDDLLLPQSPVVGDDEDEKEDSSVESNQHHECNDVVTTDGGDDRIENWAAEEELRVKLPLESTTVESGSTVVVMGGGSGGKCCNYNSVRSSAWILGMAVPAVRSVNI